MANIHFRTKLNTPCKEQLALPFYNLLPKDEIGLLKWRIYVRQRALEDLEFRAWFDQCCSQDVVFFAASCIWLHETRPGLQQDVGKFPMLLDCDQADLLAMLQKHAGRIDMTVSKTRGIGASYLMDIFILWFWKYKGQKIEFAIVTKDADSLDVKDKPSTLMGKLDLLFEELPAWMKVDESGSPILKRTTTDHVFKNLVNGNMITGYVATDAKLRSGRFYLVFLDEAAFFPSDIQRWAASAEGTTFSIIWLSTFDGTSNMFYRISQDDNAEIDVVRMETWAEDNPRWAAGKYISKNGQIEIQDKAYIYPIDYQFSHEEPGTWRSPMVDRAFRRPGTNKQQLREEIYGLAVKDSRKLFSSPRTLEVFAKSPVKPVWQGDYIDGEWIEDWDKGPIKLWVKPDAFTGVYAAGADPSLGSLTGAKAGFSVMDVKTGLYVLTARFEGLDCVAFAQKCVEICKAICGPRSAGLCMLAWESTGINFAFTNEVARLRYPSVWYEPGKSSPGCHNQDAGEAWLLEMGRAITAADGIIKDEAAFAEFRAWEYNRKHELIFASQDGHGDLGIACSITWRAGAARRKAILQSQKAAKKSDLTELHEYNMRERKQTYSDRFERRKRA